MTLNERVAQAKEKLQEFIRIAYLPDTEEVQKTYDTTSKYGGYPYLRNKQDWPICPDCKHHMNLFLQLDLANIPLKYADNKGLLQVFYCAQDYSVDCNASNDNYQSFSKGVVIRKIEVDGESSQADLGKDESYMYPELRVQSWEAIQDFPHPEHYDDLGIELEDDVVEALYEDDDNDEIAAAGDKIGGWEHFIQSNEKIYDSQDRTEYTYLIQIDSEDNVPYMFGDSGIAFIGYHPDKPEKLAMFWQCC